MVPIVLTACVHRGWRGVRENNREREEMKEKETRERMDAFFFNYQQING